MTTPHEILNPESLAPPMGFSHAVAAAEGRLVFLGGQTAHGPDGKLHGETVVEQFDRAAANVVAALDAAGAASEHLVSIQIFATDLDEYRSSLDGLASAYRRHFGKHYPAVSLFGVTGLFDPAAKIELVGIAVVPE